ncbi:hypothetical protein [Microbacterium sp.]|uniref:hypothetical protein n=1 Tax=Microbacterium sp. TaxID=51671 RepID=UPI0028A63ECB|nr:hypothetical protein [Microbacterium sp.]
MVRISSVTPGNQNVKPHPTETECFTQIVKTTDGEVLLHISTFGSASRASEPKSSQSMQFDADSAAALVTIMADAFGPRILPAR